MTSLHVGEVISCISVFQTSVIWVPLAWFCTYSNYYTHSFSLTQLSFSGENYLLGFNLRNTNIHKIMYNICKSYNFSNTHAPGIAFPITISGLPPLWETTAGIKHKCLLLYFQPFPQLISKSTPCRDATIWGSCVECGQELLSTFHFPVVKIKAKQPRSTTAKFEGTKSVLPGLLQKRWQRYWGHGGQGMRGRHSSDACSTGRLGTRIPQSAVSGDPARVLRSCGTERGEGGGTPFIGRSCSLWSPIIRRPKKQEAGYQRWGHGNFACA